MKESINGRHLLSSARQVLAVVRSGRSSFPSPASCLQTSPLRRSIIHAAATSLQAQEDAFVLSEWRERDLFVRLGEGEEPTSPPQATCPQLINHRIAQNNISLNTLFSKSLSSTSRSRKQSFSQRILHSDSDRRNTG